MNHFLIIWIIDSSTLALKKTDIAHFWHLTFTMVLSTAKISGYINSLVRKILILKFSANGEKWKNWGETEIRTWNLLFSQQIVYQLTYLAVPILVCTDHRYPCDDVICFFSFPLCIQNGSCMGTSESTLRKICSDQCPVSDDNVRKYSFSLNEVSAKFSPRKPLQCSHHEASLYSKPIYFE